MDRPTRHEKLEPLGQAWLVRELALPTPPLLVESRRIASRRRITEVQGSPSLVLHHVRRASVEDTVVSQLRFAFRHEALDMGVLAALFDAMDPAELEEWVRREPTGALSRRVWFLYETLTGRTLDVENAKHGNYTEAMDSRKHFVAVSRRSRRHRVGDNLLGGPGLCVTVRRTKRLRKAVERRTDLRLRELLAACEPEVLDRAVRYLHTTEVRASFAIEGDRPTPRRTERFVAAMREAASFEPTDEGALAALQSTIVDPRYAAVGWRDEQTFVGGTGAGFREEVQFVCPKPEDVPDLMEGWATLYGRVVEGEVPAVLAAAVAAFAFVFVHPFNDGNGRIHRFLVHHVLARTAYAPSGAVFPVSAAILRDRAGYDRVLESFSRPRLALTDWRWTRDGAMVVRGDTARLYRYFDATPFAEYLHERLDVAVERDAQEEIDFIVVFDRAFDAVRGVVKMPDRRAALLVRLCMQNRGRMPKRKRHLFPELTDEEVAAMEDAVREALAAGGV